MNYLGLAPIKINLTLKILGRNNNNYHDIISLIAFANDGNLVYCNKSIKTSIDYIYDFSHTNKEKIVKDTSKIFLNQLYKQKLITDKFNFVINKRIPFSSGLGGSIIDAALIARMLAEKNPKIVDGLKSNLQKISSDGLACFYAKAALIAKTGNDINLINSFFSDFAIIIACPNYGLSTKDVYHKNQVISDKSAIHEHDKLITSPISTYKDFIDFLKKQDNDLQKSACQIMPDLKKRIMMINSIKNVDYANISGSGSAIFAICEKKNLTSVYENIFTNKDFKWNKIFSCRPYQTT